MRYFQNVETDEIVVAETEADVAAYRSELIEDTTNHLWREVSAPQVEE